MTKKKKIITLLVKFITLSGSITLLVVFITLSGSITLSGVYYIIGAKYYNWYISRYSSSFYGGHFENRYPNQTGHIKWILARKNDLKKSLLHYWLNLLHYRDVLHYWLIFITFSGSITLLGVYYISGAKYYNLHISRYSSKFYGGHFENRHPKPTGHIMWILAR